LEQRSFDQGNPLASQILRESTDLETASLTCSSTMEVEEPRQPPTLPMDLLLEIIARSNDVTTVVRCAAGCKPLRRAMLDPGFLDRLRRHAKANGGFDPSLLTGCLQRCPPALTPSSSSHPDASVSTLICFLLGPPKLHPPATGSSCSSGKSLPKPKYSRSRRTISVLKL
jgi:hypothetical protein